MKAANKYSGTVATRAKIIGKVSPARFNAWMDKVTASGYNAATFYRTRAEWNAAMAKAGV